MKNLKQYTKIHISQTLYKHLSHTLSHHFEDQTPTFQRTTTRTRRATLPPTLADHQPRRRACLPFLFLCPNPSPFSSSLPPPLNLEGLVRKQSLKHHRLLHY
ncbi:hypothetical protein PIB30_105317 [Stylosanthes scabra]|uniref:Uncharacterized protein n=1 Tax=Stylosanthes scabra TaxID=79078 RepID=A0ABU6RYF1_9FABA|nr:hypothetical protein [Stylosanthes scabra]